MRYSTIQCNILQYHGDIGDREIGDREIGDGEFGDGEIWEWKTLRWGNSGGGGLDGKIWDREVWGTNLRGGNLGEGHLEGGNLREGNLGGGSSDRYFERGIFRRGKFGMGEIRKGEIWEGKIRVGGSGGGYWEMGSMHLRTTRWSGSASLWARWVTALPFHGAGVHTNQRNSTAKRFDEEKTAQSYFTTLIQFVNQRQILKLAYFSTIKCEYKTDPNVYMNFQITLTCGYKLQRRTSTTCCFSMRQVIDRWVNQHSMLSAFSKKPGATLIEWN